MQTKDFIEVAVVEDDRGLREGFQMLIDGTAGFHCDRAFNTVEEALRRLGEPLPDVLLLDIHLPGMLGSEAVKIFREKFPAMQVMMLTVYGEEDLIFDS